MTARAINTSAIIPYFFEIEGLFRGDIRGFGRFSFGWGSGRQIPQILEKEIFCRQVVDLQEFLQAGERGIGSAGLVVLDAAGTDAEQLRFLALRIAGFLS